MTLKISNTGPIIYQDLKDYIDQRFEGVYFDSIKIDLYGSPEDEENNISKVVEIQYPNIGLILENTICVLEEDLNQNTINWLSAL